MADQVPIDPAVSTGSLLPTARLCFLLAAAAVVLPIGGMQLFHEWLDTPAGIATALTSTLLVLVSTIGEFRVATSKNDWVRAAAIVAVISGFCALTGLFLRAISTGGNGIGDVFLVVVGYPGLFISSLLAWLLSESE